MLVSYTHRDSGFDTLLSEICADHFLSLRIPPAIW
jgi:hypothetical protein